MVGELHNHCLPMELPEPEEEDALLFEDLEDSADYVDVRPEDSSSYIPSSVEYLQELIEIGEYADAKRVLLDLHALGMVIPPSFKYLKAVHHALGLPVDSQGTVVDLTAQERLDDFSLWFELIPSVVTSGKQQFASTRRLIFWAPVANLALIMRFGLMCAEKGYARLLNTAVIPPVMRFADPDVSLKFIEEYEAKDEQFWRSGQFEHRPNISLNLMLSFRSIRSIAVRNLAQAGHLDAAMRLLPDPNHPKGRLPHYTYTKLMDYIRASPVPQRQHYLDATHEIYESVLNKKDSNIDHLDESSMTRQFSTAERYPVENLVQSLKYIKSTILTDDRLPHPYDLMDFISQYTSSGRTHALELLRKRAFRSSPKAASLFIFCQMVVHYRNGDYDAVIRTFTDNFYLVGVPREIVLRRLRQNSPNYALEAIATSISHRDKLWPEPVHCSLVWHSLLVHLRRPQEVRYLYDRLLSFAKGEGVQDDAIGDAVPLLTSSFQAEFRPWVGVPALPIPPPWRPPIATETFTPFMMRLMKHSGAEAGTKVLSDMVKCRIQPTVYHFTELARFYAFTGDQKRAFMILDRLEKRLEMEERRAASLRTESEPEQDLNFSLETLGAVQDQQPLASAVKVEVTPESPPPSIPTSSLPASEVRDQTKNTLPSADYVLYTALMRAFLGANNLDAVAEVNRRLLLRHQYVPNQEPVLEKIYHDWRAAIETAKVAEKREKKNLKPEGTFLRS
ncbi:hypothetical protein K435DRAFT_804208 [Dendrothele bispora CBS 962.96]|uniref:Uncharacterized protein n=1 Tax=Dendrothele bispora (strain CBS 962.96) TaxID=1314807 RepID=A0A4S8LEZ7_DENBC|nr:hypothetical protein K435DRAFT_804208 [Dendrothele bispora CBS 962.96]